MKSILTTLFIALLFNSINAQSVLKNYKTKTTENEKERQQIIDVVRAYCKNEGYPEFKFVVNHLMLKGKYAFFKGDALNKDGSKYSSNKEGDDCCHVEVVLTKDNTNEWVLFMGGIFSTDVWYGCLWKEHNIPKDIFDYTESCNW